MLLQFSETSTATMSTYLTCEFATFSKDGTPIAWPVSALYQPESTTLLVSTTIGFPQKAINVRRDPRVSALYSDPTGSGSDDGVQVLLQGTAVCTDQIETGFAGRAARSRLLVSHVAMIGDAGRRPPETGAAPEGSHPPHPDPFRMRRV